MHHPGKFRSRAPLIFSDGQALWRCEVTFSGTAREALPGTHTATLSGTTHLAGREDPQKLWRSKSSESKKACQASIEGEPTRLAASLGVPLIVLPFYPLFPQEHIASNAHSTRRHCPISHGTRALAVNGYSCGPASVPFAYCDSSVVLIRGQSTEYAWRGKQISPQRTQGNAEGKQGQSRLRFLCEPLGPLR